MAVKSSLRPMRAGHSGRNTEADEDGTADPALDAWEHAAPAQPLARSSGAERPERIGDEPEYEEREPECDDLERDAAVRVDELRQEGEEEERRLGIQHVDDDSVAK